MRQGGQAAGRPETPHRAPAVPRGGAPPLLPSAARGHRRRQAAFSARCCAAWAQCRAARAPGPLPSMERAAWLRWGLASWPGAPGLQPCRCSTQQGPRGPRRCRPTTPHAPGGRPGTHLHDRQVQRGRCRRRAPVWGPQAGDSRLRRRAKCRAGWQASQFCRTPTRLAVMPKQLQHCVTMDGLGGGGALRVRPLVLCRGSTAGHPAWHGVQQRPCGPHDRRGLPPRAGATATCERRAERRRAVYWGLLFGAVLIWLTNWRPEVLCMLDVMSPQVPAARRSRRTPPRRSRTWLPASLRRRRTSCERRVCLLWHESLIMSWVRACPRCDG